MELTNMMNTDIREIKRLNLIRLMEEHKLKSADLARLIERDPPYIAAILKPTGKVGSRSLGRKLLKAICDKLNIDESEFVKIPIEDGQNGQADDNFGRDWSDDLKNLCLELKEILETADDVSIAALKMNMAMIKGAVKDRATAKKDREERIRLKKRVDHLEKELKTREPHGCAEAPGDYLPTAEKET